MLGAMSQREPAPETGWVLEGYLEGSDSLVVTQVSSFPFRIGRGARMGLRLNSKGVSSLHAELTHDGVRLWVRDLDSTNGTYVNRRRVREPQPVHDGDVLHFATSEFVLRLIRDDSSEERTVYRTIEDLPQRAGGRQRIAQLIDRQAVVAYYQPIVRLDEGREVVGWEALGRGRMEGLPESPALLLDRAAIYGRAAELSQLFRVRAAGLVAERADHVTLFLNCHPDELGGRLLVAQLEDLRAAYPDIDLVLEIHERAVTDVSQLRQLVADLSSIGIRTAYDDFGAGQARLLELVEATPAYVKFDKAWTRSMGKRDGRHDQLVRTLVSMVHDFGIVPVCEGIEDEQQLAACREAGFALGQGFLFARPASADRVFGPPSRGSCAVPPADPGSE